MKLEPQLHHYLKTKCAGIWFSSSCIHRVEPATMVPHTIKFSKVPTLIISDPPFIFLFLVKRQSRKSNWTLTDPLTNKLLLCHLFHAF